MPDSQPSEHQKHPSVSEHPEQRRQEETGHEDASDPSEVGRNPSMPRKHATAPAVTRTAVPI
jgi:hypothetical protein